MAGIVRRRRLYFGCKELSSLQPKKLLPTLWRIPDVIGSCGANQTVIARPENLLAKRSLSTDSKKPLPKGANSSSSLRSSKTKTLSSLLSDKEKFVLMKGNGKERRKGKGKENEKGKRKGKENVPKSLSSSPSKGIRPSPEERSSSSKESQRSGLPITISTSPSPPLKRNSSGEAWPVREAWAHTGKTVRVGDKTIDFAKIWQTNGILFIDKPEGVTSRHADKASLTEYFEDLGMDPWARKPQTNTHVQKQKKKSVNKRLKYGHFGTLDPFATGLLPIGFGHGTKFGDLLPLQTKTYSARLQLGVATDSDDLKGKEIERGPSDWKMPSAEVVQALCEEHFLGDIFQTPPMYSAIRVDGERAYKKARRGEEVKMKPRKAFIHDITSRIISPTVIEFDVTAAAGLYVRTVGSDLARKLGTCGHLIGLRRTAMGAVRLDSFGSNKALLMDLFDLFGQFPRVRSKYDLQTTCTRLAQSVSVAKMLDKRDTNLKPGTFATIYADDVPLCLIEFHPHGHSKIKLNFVPSTLLETP